MASNAGKDSTKNNAARPKALNSKRSRTRGEEDNGSEPAKRQRLGPDVEQDIGYQEQAFLRGNPGVGTELVVAQTCRWSPIPGHYCSCFLKAADIPIHRLQHSNLGSCKPDEHLKHAFRHVSGAYQLLRLASGPPTKVVLYWTDEPWKQLRVKAGERRIVVRHDLRANTRMHQAGADWPNAFLTTMDRLKMDLDTSPAKFRLTQVLYEDVPLCDAIYELVLPDKDVPRFVEVVNSCTRLTLIDDDARIVGESGRHPPGQVQPKEDRKASSSFAENAKQSTESSLAGTSGELTLKVPDAADSPAPTPLHQATEVVAHLVPAGPRVSQTARKITARLMDKNTPPPLVPAEPRVSQTAPKITSRLNDKNTANNQTTHTITTRVIDKSTATSTLVHSEAQSSGDVVPSLESQVTPSAGSELEGVERSPNHGDKEPLDLALQRLAERAQSSPGMRRVFMAHVAGATAATEAEAPAFRIKNEVDDDPCPRGFLYTNDIIYGKGVPPLDKKAWKGCDCYGPCDPRSKTCSCVRRQAEYMVGGQEGFQHSESGELQATSAPAIIIECNPNCMCSPRCQNRVIQHGRQVHLRFEKTANKGWGVFATKRILKGSFVGVYAGEMITDAEAEQRGLLYDQIGRTYHFSIDFYHIQQHRERQRVEAVRGNSVPSARIASDAEGDPFSYVMDGFHMGNFTRLINHSCEPNLDVHAAYFAEVDIEKPLMVFYANQVVEKGEELTLSYFGNTDPIGDQEVPIQGSGKRGRERNSVDKKCLCGTKSCRGYMFD